MIGISEFSRNQKLSFDRGELEGVLNELDYTPEKLVALFEKDFKREFSSNAGVWEKYTIKQHTLMVLKQFDKYFNSIQLPLGIPHKFFRVMLVLHDIGKPEAIVRGGKQLQYEYTKRLMIPILSELKYTDQEINIATALVSADPIGSYLAKHNSAQKSAEIIRSSAYCISTIWSMLAVILKMLVG